MTRLVELSEVPAPERVMALMGVAKPTQAELGAGPEGHDAVRDPARAEVPYESCLSGSTA